MQVNTICADKAEKGARSHSTSYAEISPPSRALGKSELNDGCVKSTAAASAPSKPQGALGELPLQASKIWSSWRRYPGNPLWSSTSCDPTKGPHSRLCALRLFHMPLKLSGGQPAAEKIVRKQTRVLSAPRGFLLPSQSSLFLSLLSSCWLASSWSAHPRGLANLLPPRIPFKKQFASFNGFGEKEKRLGNQQSVRAGGGAAVRPREAGAGPKHQSPRSWETRRPAHWCSYRGRAPSPEDKTRVNEYTFQCTIYDGYKKKTTDDNHYFERIITLKWAVLSLPNLVVFLSFPLRCCIFLRFFKIKLINI